MRIAFLGLLLVLVAAASHSESPVPRIEDLMSSGELEATGVSTLTVVQRAALSQWLAEYTERVTKASQGVTVKRGYPRLGTGHWVSEVVESGQFIKLEDGSLWQIPSYDKFDTTRWSMLDHITVLPNDDRAYGFDYILVNTDRGNRVWAKHLGN
jgi:hypothetical protein